MEKLVRRLLKQTRNDGDPDSRICMVGFWIYFEDRALNTLCFFLKVLYFHGLEIHIGKILLLLFNISRHILLFFFTVKKF